MTQRAIDRLSSAVSRLNALSDSASAELRAAEASLRGFGVSGGAPVPVPGRPGVAGFSIFYGRGACQEGGDGWRLTFSEQPWEQASRVDKILAARALSALMEQLALNAEKMLAATEAGPAAAAEAPRS